MWAIKLWMPTTNRFLSHSAIDVDHFNRLCQFANCLHETEKPIPNIPAITHSHSIKHTIIIQARSIFVGYLPKHYLIYRHWLCRCMYLCALHLPESRNNISHVYAISFENICTWALVFFCLPLPFVPVVANTPLSTSTHPKCVRTHSPLYIDLSK